MTDTIVTLSWVLIGAWYVFVLATVPEAPNAPPRSSRFWLAHKLLGGRRLWMTLLGVIVIGTATRFIIAAYE